jgi:hypothetical protein
MKNCPKCFQNQDDEVEKCDCGYQFLPTISKVISSGNSEISVIQKYPHLRAISGYFEIIAWFNLVISIALAAALFISSSQANSIPAIGGVIGLILYGMLLFVIIRSLGELIYVLIDIEENLRKLVSSNNRKN